MSSKRGLYGLLYSAKRYCPKYSGFEYAKTLAQQLFKEERPAHVNLRHAGLNALTTNIYEKGNTEQRAALARDLFHAGIQSIECSQTHSIGPENIILSSAGVQITHVVETMGELESFLPHKRMGASVVFPLGVAAQFNFLDQKRSASHEFKDFLSLRKRSLHSGVPHEVYVMRAFSGIHKEKDLANLILDLRHYARRVILSDSSGVATPEKVDAVLRSLPKYTIDSNLCVSFWRTEGNRELSNLITALSHGITQVNVGFNDPGYTRISDLETYLLLTHLDIQTDINGDLLKIADKRRREMISTFK